MVPVPERTFSLTISPCSSNIFLAPYNADGPPPFFCFLQAEGYSAEMDIALVDENDITAGVVGSIAVGLNLYVLISVFILHKRTDERAHQDDTTRMRTSSNSESPGWLVRCKRWMLRPIAHISSGLLTCDLRNRSPVWPSR